MPATVVEWRFVSSRWQRVLNWLSALTAAVFLSVLFLPGPAIIWGAAVLIAVIASVALIVALTVAKRLGTGNFRINHPHYHLRLSTDGWWLDRGRGLQPVTWRAGSVRRRHWVRLVWGRWPWQVIDIRPDSFFEYLPERALQPEHVQGQASEKQRTAHQAFRRLKWHLYGVI